MSIPNLETTLKQLRLSGLAGTVSLRLQEAAANRLSHEEFLEILLQDELNVRQERLLSGLGPAAEQALLTNSTCAKSACSAAGPRPLTFTASKRWRILTGALIPAFPANRSMTWPPASSSVSPSICY